MTGQCINIDGEWCLTDGNAVVRLIDLSAPIVPGPQDAPDILRTEIEFVDHAGGAAQIKAMFGVGRELLRDGEGWAIEAFTRFGTHNSTHVDAPYHYNSTIAGRPAQTIDQLPLDTPGRVPWWPQGGQDVTLQRVIVHVIYELARHAGHADIMREQHDGEIGWQREKTDVLVGYDWPAYVAKLTTLADRFR